MCARGIAYFPKMKTITTITWVVIGVCSLGFCYPIATAKTQEERMAASMLILVYFPLAILAVLNFLPYRWTRITAFAIIALPVIYWALSFVINFCILMSGGKIEGYDINQPKQNTTQQGNDSTCG